VSVDALPACDALPIRLWKCANWDLLGDFFTHIIGMPFFVEEMLATQMSVLIIFLVF